MIHSNLYNIIDFYEFVGVYSWLVSNDVFYAGYVFHLLLVGQFQLFQLFQRNLLEVHNLVERLVRMYQMFLAPAWVL